MNVLAFEEGCEWGGMGGGRESFRGHNVGKLSECLAVYADNREGRAGQKNVLLSSLFGAACHLLLNSFRLKNNKT